MMWIRNTHPGERKIPPPSIPPARGGKIKGRVTRTFREATLAYSEFSQRSQVGWFGAKSVKLFLREPLVRVLRWFLPWRLMKTILRIDRDADFLPPGGELRLTRSDIAAPAALTTSVHGLCFQDDKVLMINDKENRGWNIPGGHVENGENLEEALKRELREEAAVAVDGIKPVGYYHIHIEGPEPPDLPGPYPDGCMQIFFCRLIALQPFTLEYETTARRLFAPAEAREQDWVRNNPEMYDLGLEAAQAIPGI